MTDTERSPMAEQGWYLRSAEPILLAERRAERARRKAEAALRSAIDSLERAADSFSRSAASQDQTAATLEDAAELNGREDFRDYAARHRRFAEDDRRMAQQLRRK